MEPVENTDHFQMNDDEDDEGFVSSSGLNKCTSSFVFSVNDAFPRQSISTVIFTTGLPSVAFGKNYLTDFKDNFIGKMEKVENSKLENSDLEMWGLRVKKQDPSYLHQINENTVLCSCSSSLDFEDFYSFSSTILSSFAGLKNVVVLTTMGSSEFKDDSQPDEIVGHFARVLSTSSFQDNLSFIKLEAPNILSGVSAGILTFCELKRIPAICCIVYSCSLDLDLGAVDAFTKFLSSLKITSQLKLNASGEIIVSDKRTVTGNLYI